MFTTTVEGGEPDSILRSPTAKLQKQEQHRSHQNSIKMPSDTKVIGGHKANLHNPNTSSEAKDHSKEVLQQDFNGESTSSSRTLPFLMRAPGLTTFSVVVDGNKTKDLDHVAAGLKG